MSSLQGARGISLSGKRSARSVPPASAEGVKQGYDGSSAIGLRLDVRQTRFKIGLLRGNEDRNVHLAALDLRTNDVNRLSSRVFSRARSAHGAATRLQALQGIGNVLKGRQDNASVLRFGLDKSLLGRSLLVGERASIEQRLKNIPGNRPEAGARIEQARDLFRRAPRVRRQRNLRKSVCDCYADLRACSVNVCLRRTHIRPLAHQVTRNA